MIITDKVAILDPQDNPHVPEVAGAKIVLVRLSDDEYSVVRDSSFSLSKISHTYLGSDSQWGERIILRPEALQRLQEM